MKLVIDMNLSPLWVDFFVQQGVEAVHWSTIGDPRAADRTILDWARTNQHVVFTHDLDFGIILAATQADSPSVLQIRTHDVLPASVGPIALAAVQQFRQLLEQGALVTVDERSLRARILPIKR